MSECRIDDANNMHNANVVSIGILGRVTLAEAINYRIESEYKNEAELLIEQLDMWVPPIKSQEKFLHLGKHIVEISSYQQEENLIYSVNHSPNVYHGPSVKTKLQADSLILTPQNGMFGEKHLFDTEHLDDRGIPKSGCSRPLRDIEWRNVLIPVRKALQHSPLLFDKHK